MTKYRSDSHGQFRFTFSYPTRGVTPLWQEGKVYTVSAQYGRYATRMVQQYIWDGPLEDLLQGIAEGSVRPCTRDEAALPQYHPERDVPTLHLRGGNDRSYSHLTNLVE